jgi:hypothetical protein
MMVEGKPGVPEHGRLTSCWCPLANSGGLASIAGRWRAETGQRGVLVVAEGPATATADQATVDGAFVIFNVVPGGYSVRGYAAGVAAAAGMATAPLALGRTSRPADAERGRGIVSGTVSIVNGPGRID